MDIYKNINESIGYSESPLVWLISSYTAPGRYYHDLSHLNFMFKLARSLNLKLNEIQTWAILGHDVHYIPGDPENEKKSAEETTWVLQHLEEPPLSDQACKDISTIILDTKLHVPSTEESALVLDLDMAILGAPWDEYERYARGVMNEFGLPLETWIKGREERFIEPTLKSDKIFHTKLFQDLFEGPARFNLEEEFRWLEDLEF